MDKKIILFFFMILDVFLFSHPYDIRVAELMIKAKNAYFEKNPVVLLSVAYELLYLEEIEDLKKVLKLSEEVVIIRESAAGALHISNIYKRLGLEKDFIKWKIVYERINTKKGKKWKKD